jgi:3-dehydroquinate dehydratase-2
LTSEEVTGVTSVLVLNGPNLNLLGTRQPDVYGTKTLDDVQRLCQERADQLGLAVEFKQSNHEGQLVDWLQEVGADVKAGKSIGAVLNPGGFTHTSVVIRDAIEATGLPVIEVHVSNIHAREEWRHLSRISPVAAGVIVGLGVHGYPLAIEALHGLAHARA